MKKYFLFALLAMFIVGCDSPNANYPSGGESDDDGGGDSNNRSYVVTGEAKDVTHKSVTLYGEVNVEIADYETIEWGMMYSADKAELESHLGTKVLAEGALEEDMYFVSVTGLESETKYYYCAFVYVNNQDFKYGSIENFTTAEKPTDSGVLNGHEWIDLGLPSGLKWATCNVGATKPEEYGDYFAWGETEPKEYYDWSTYKWCRGSYDTQTKYCTDSYFGTVDNKTQLELSDDAARANWGGSWRMPTDAELTELREQCTWTWTTQNGVYGYKVTSKKSGYTNMSIFLPAAGYRYDSSLGYAGSDGYYWSSSLYTDYTGSPYDAWSVSFGSDYVGRYYYFTRLCGFSVRPLCQ